MRKILSVLPEFADHYMTLVEDADGDPSPPAVFSELADYVAELIEQFEACEPQLVRCLGAIEQVATSSDDAQELVGWAFLDSLSPDHLRRLDPWFGSGTRAMLEELEQS